MAKYPNHSPKVIFERLYKINEFTRNCEMLLDWYDPQKIFRDFVSLRANNQL